MLGFLLYFRQYNLIIVRIAYYKVVESFGICRPITKLQILPVYYLKKEKARVVKFSESHIYVMDDNDITTLNQKSRAALLFMQRSIKC